ncbi:MAG: type-F conjugative transfer system secretin TraK [Candidatus Tectimicrobiota bacterium]
MLAGCLLLLVSVLLTLPTLTMAGRTVVLTDEPLLVRLAPRQPTAVTFPEPIAAVPTGADPQQLSLELDGSRLFLQPREPAVTGLLFAIGVSGRSYALRFAVGAPADTEVVITVPTPSVQPGSASRAAVAPAEVSWRRLLRAMLQGTTLPGVTEAPMTQDLGEVDGLRLTAVRRYMSGGLLGYIAEAANPADTPRAVRLHTFTAPGLLAITTALDTLPGQGTTRLYLVVHARTP